MSSVRKPDLRPKTEAEFKEKHGLWDPSIRKLTKIRGQGIIISVNDTDNNLSPVTMTPAIILLIKPLNNLSPVSMQISSQIFVTIRNGPEGIFRGQGKTDS